MDNNITSSHIIRKTYKYRKTRAQ